MAKGAAMIGPNMATMLGLVLTDAPLTVADAQALLTRVTEVTFNCIHVDGHMSTNDTVLLLANGAAGGAPLAGDESGAVRRGAAGSLHRTGAGDSGRWRRRHAPDHDRRRPAARVVAAARQIARTVADSPLVQTAVAGADPNWGRIVSAAGYAGVAFDPAGVDLRINDHPLYERGRPLEFDAAKVSASIRDNRDTHVELRVSRGNGATCASGPPT